MLSLCCLLLNQWQEKEDPEMAMELRKMSIDYERRRMQLQVYFGDFMNIFVALLIQLELKTQIFQLSPCDV